MSDELARWAEAARQGRYDEARAGVDALLLRERGNVEAHALAAWIADARGDDEGCMRHLAEVFARDPDHRAALSLALAIAGRRGDADAALTIAQRLARLEPDAAWAHFNLAATHSQRGESTDARAGYDRAIALDPGFALARRARAWLALEAREFDAARTDLEQALRSAPQDATILVELGMLELRRYDGAAARARFERAVALDPRLAPAWRGLSQAMELVGGDAEAILDASSRAVALAGEDAENWFEHAKCLSRQGEIDAARSAAVRALDAAPAWQLPRWLLFQGLPYPLSGDEAIDRSRRIWRAGLAAFEALPLDGVASPSELAALLTLQPNFHRHYLGDDLTEDQRRYGALVSHIAHAALPSVSLPPPRGEPRRWRIGFASAHLRRHTIWKLFHQWLARLDRERFEVVAIYLGATVDATVRGLPAIADAVIGPLHTNEAWVDALQRARLDALVWLDVGMDGLTQLLAPLRFAPLQCATWGHPVTTGLDAIDLFLSGEAMEPPGADAHYTERLVRLPGIGIAYAPPQQPEGYARARRTGDPARFACVQSVHKLLPWHDALFAQILAGVPGSTLSLTPHPSPKVRERLAARMRKAFALHGVDFDARVRMHAYLDEGKFLELLRGADVLLDSVGWSGGNTTLEALAFDLPVVTLPGAFMRARHTHGILAGLGLDAELSAANEEAYVSTAIRLATDAALHGRVSRAMAERKHAVFDDARPIRALEAVLEDELAQQ